MMAVIMTIFSCMEWMHSRFQKVKVLKGDVTALDQENAIAAVYKQDDYNKKLITVTGPGWAIR